MSIVFELEADEEYFPLYGLVTNLPGYKICAKLSLLARVELTHELAYERKCKSISIMKNSAAAFFDKYIWADKESEHRIELIHNITTLENEMELPKTGGLFENEPIVQNVVLLEEWKRANFIIKVEGENCFFTKSDLKKIQGVQMVLEEPVEYFKDYHRIL